MKTSAKHHYLPQCYLKGFRSDEGEIFVYNKKSGEIFSKKDTRDIFQQNHRNSFVNPKTGQKHDTLEQLYSFIDYDFAQLLQKVIDSTHEKPALDFEEKLEFMIGLSMLYWRVPSKDKEGQMLMRTQGFDKGPMQVVYEKTGTPIESELLEKILKYDGMEGVYKMGMSFAPFYSEDALMNVMNWRFLYQDPGKLITGDNPILKRNNIKDPKHILDEFIFPVSAGRLIICSQDFAQLTSVDKSFSLKVGIAIIEQAQQFVCSNDRDHLNLLINLHRVSQQHLSLFGGNLLDFLFWKAPKDMGE